MAAQGPNSNGLKDLTMGTLTDCIIYARNHTPSLSGCTDTGGPGTLGLRRGDRMFACLATDMNEMQDMFDAPVPAMPILKCRERQTWAPWVGARDTHLPRSGLTRLVTRIELGVVSAFVML